MKRSKVLSQFIGDTKKKINTLIKNQRSKETRENSLKRNFIKK